MQHTIRFSTITLLLTACDPSVPAPAPESTTAFPGPQTTCGSTDGSGDSFSAPGPATTGDSEDDELSLCEASCDFEANCFGYDDNRPDCIDACLYNLHAFDGDENCASAMFDSTTCLAEAKSCNPPCIEPTSLAVYACEQAHSVVCSSIDNGQSGPQCDYTEWCEFMGGAIVREFTCDGTACACLENGTEIASCVASACGDFRIPIDSDWSDAARTCCGWDDTTD